MEISLKNKIKKKVSSRISFSLILTFLLMLTLTIYDIHNALLSKEHDLKKLSKDIDNYIVSQMLIGNKDAIYYKLKKEEQANHLLIQWKEDAQDYNDIISFSWPFNWRLIHQIDSITEGNFGAYVINGSLLDDPELIRSTLVRIVLFVFFLMFVIWILWPLYYKIPHDLILKPISELLITIGASNQGNQLAENNSTNIKEINLLKNKIISMVNEIKSRTKENVALNIAQQVAHDIRSPLLALESLYSISPELSLKKRNMIRTIVRRINTIINSLSDISNHNDLVIDEQIGYNCFIYNLMTNILEEKKLEYHNRRIQFISLISDNLIGVVTHFNEEKFERCLSNILNNSIEALDFDGFISVEANLQGKLIHITISDNGKGIPPGQLENIYTKGFSFDKKGGKGLGLTFAKECIDNFDGRLEIQSCPGEGTVVELYLNARPLPIWLTNKINLSDYSQICLLDDENETHEVWRQKLSNKIKKEKIYSFHDAEKFVLFLKNNNQTEKTLFLIEYMLDMNNISGLQLIDDFNLKPYSFLVTNSYNDKNLINLCIEKSIKIIPKCLIAHIDFC